ncbi:AI-2E family transporter [Planococcus salinus]|uniref:AI-2E family transporter n=1 Tax=Planococcus salinus TaxID=1848460 RepID=A0A3M8P632_9BACL|nr:AI-2E family transporter [Planococcus salinus]RNF39156.1 AI-2E family transporter [Planococcus salinus]
MWIQKPFFEYTTGILLVVITIFFLGKIDYFLWPFQVIITTLFAPVVLAGVLYYILRPVVELLSRYVPKTAGILIIFGVIAILFTALFYYFGPTIQQQVKDIVEMAPEKVEEVTEESENAITNLQIGGLSGAELLERVTGYVETLSERLLENIMDIVSMLMNVVIVLVLVPFILFFLLKDDNRLKPYLMKYIPENHKAEGEKLLKDVNQTLSTFIVGQVIVAGVVGVLMYIGYLIIGLEYALSLAIFAMFLVVVPFLGPIIGIIPAVFVALMNQDFFMAVKVLLVLGVVQQLEGNLVTPNIMGNRLNIHPLTIILLLLVAGALYGFVGILIAIPLYAVLKTLIHNFRLFLRLRKKREVANKNGN